MNSKLLEFRSGTSAASDARERVADAGPVVEPQSAPSVVIIEPRALLRDCLVGCFRSELGQAVAAYASVDDWRRAGGGKAPCALVLSTGGRSRKSESIHDEITKLARLSNAITLVLLADAEEPQQIVEALNNGARGYIPTSSSLAVAIEAVRLVNAGGVYVPASSLVEASRKNDELAEGGANKNGYFTPRQLAVLDGLRRGRANKVIANELRLRESTVKVHIRNLMKKLGASNRTEVVYRANSILKEDGGYSATPPLGFNIPKQRE